MNIRTCLLFILFSIIFINIGSASILNITVSDDAYVDSVNPNTNYGTQQELQTYNTDPPYKIIYLQFNTSSIPNGSTINSVDLYTYFYSGVADSSCGEDWGNRIESWRLNSIFNESTVTYNTKPSTVAAQGGELICIGSDFEWKTLNVAYPYSLNSGNIFGIQLIMRTPFAQQYEGPLYFYSKEYGSLEPYISIDYTSNSPSAPTISSYSNTQTSDSSTSFFVNSSQSVTFNVTISQPIDTYTWYLDDVSLGNQWETNASIDDKIIALDYQPHTVKMNATNTNGTTWQNWTINAGRTLTYESLQIVPSTITQGQSTTVTAWITNYNDTSSANVTITSPSSSTITLSLPYTGSDLFSGTFSQTNEAGRYYVTHTTIDGITKTNGLVYPFIIERLPTESTGGSSSNGGSNGNNNNDNEDDNDNTNDELNNQDKPSIQSLPPVFQEFINNIPTSIKQTISYIITPSLYLFDILFILLILILLTVLANYEVTIEETVFFTLALFIILRLIGINLTSILTGLT